MHSRVTGRWHRIKAGLTANSSRILRWLRRALNCAENRDSFFFVCFAKLISHGIKQAKTKTETSICQKRENQAARRVTCDVCCVWLWVVFSFNYVARRVTSIFLCVSSTAFKALRFISIMTLSRGHKAGGQIKSLSPLQLLLIDQRQHFSLAFHFTLYCLSQRVSTCSMWEGTTEEKKVTSFTVGRRKMRKCHERRSFSAMHSHVLCGFDRHGMLLTSLRRFNFTLDTKPSTGGRTSVSALHILELIKFHTSPIKQLDRWEPTAGCTFQCCIIFFLVYYSGENRGKRLQCQEVFRTKFHIDCDALIATDDCERFKFLLFFWAEKSRWSWKRKIKKNCWFLLERGTKKSRSSRFEAETYSGGMSRKANENMSRVWWWGRCGCDVNLCGNV